MLFKFTVTTGIGLGITLNFGKVREVNGDGFYTIQISPFQDNGGPTLTNYYGDYDFVLSGNIIYARTNVTLMLRRLIQNTEFRNKFVNRYADEINTRFLASDVVQHFNDIYEVNIDSHARF